MPISCDTNDLLDASKCYKCIPSGEQMAVMIYLLDIIANGAPTDTNVLMDNARCYKCIPAGDQPEVMNMLLCKIATAVGA